LCFRITSEQRPPVYNIQNYVERLIVWLNSKIIKINKMSVNELSYSKKYFHHFFQAFLSYYDLFNQNSLPLLDKALLKLFFYLKKLVAKFLSSNISGKYNIFYLSAQEQPLNNDHLSTTYTILGSQGWSFVNSFDCKYGNLANKVKHHQGMWD